MMIAISKCRTVSVCNSRGLFWPCHKTLASAQCRAHLPLYSQSQPRLFDQQYSLNRPTTMGGPASILDILEKEMANAQFVSPRQIKPVLNVHSHSRHTSTRHGEPLGLLDSPSKEKNGVRRRTSLNSEMSSSENTPTSTTLPIIDLEWDTDQNLFGEENEEKKGQRSSINRSKSDQPRISCNQPDDVKRRSHRTSSEKLRKPKSMQNSWAPNFEEVDFPDSPSSRSKPKIIMDGFGEPATPCKSSHSRRMSNGGRSENGSIGSPMKSRHHASPSKPKQMPFIDGFGEPITPAKSSHSLRSIGKPSDHGSSLRSHHTSPSKNKPSMDGFCDPITPKSGHSRISMGGVSEHGSLGGQLKSYQNRKLAMEIYGADLASPENSNRDQNPMQAMVIFDAEPASPSNSNRRNNLSSSGHRKISSSSRISHLMECADASEKSFEDADSPRRRSKTPSRIRQGELQTSIGGEDAWNIKSPSKPSLANSGSPRNRPGRSPQKEEYRRSQFGEFTKVSLGQWFDQSDREEDPVMKAPVVKSPKGRHRESKSEANDPYAKSPSAKGRHRHRESKSEVENLFGKSSSKGRHRNRDIESELNDLFANSPSKGHNRHRESTSEAQEDPFGKSPSKEHRRRKSKSNFNDLFADSPFQGHCHRESHSNNLDNLFAQSPSNKGHRHRESKSEAQAWKLTEAPFEDLFGDREEEEDLDFDPFQTASTTRTTPKTPKIRRRLTRAGSLTHSQDNSNSHSSPIKSGRLGLARQANERRQRAQTPVKSRFS